MKQSFSRNALGVNPADIPVKVLNNGERMPTIGIGTFGSDLYNADQVADAVIYAAEVGQRFFDCASVYSNEKEIGAAFQVILEGGVPREELFITSKGWEFFRFYK